MLWRYYETPHHDTVTCRFDKDVVQISFMSSIAQMSSTPKDKRPVLRGTMPGVTDGQAVAGRIHASHRHRRRTRNRNRKRRANPDRGPVVRSPVVRSPVVP